MLPYRHFDQIFYVRYRFFRTDVPIHGKAARLGACKDLALCRHDRLFRAESFQMLGADPREDAVIGLYQFAQLGDVARMARAHFRNEEVAVQSLFYAPGDAQGVLKDSGVAMTL